MEFMVKLSHPSFRIVSPGLSEELQDMIPSRIILHWYMADCLFSGV